MFATDIPATIAAIAGLLSVSLTAWTILTSHRKKVAAKNVDAIQVTQDALAGTVQLQHEDNERLRARLITQDKELRLLRRRYEKLIRKCEEFGVDVNGDGDDGE